MEKEKAAWQMQHYGQRVLKNIDLPKTLILQKPELDGTYYLLLRSISQLTDEECIELAKLMGIFAVAYGIAYYRREIGYYIDGSMRLGLSFDRHLAIADYLRSISILIPWRGYSVEDILNRGWAKIKTT